MDRYGQLQHQFELDGGYEYEIKIKQVLDGLNFGPEDYHRPIAQLSGGQKTRALLGRLLLESPDVLILDEPTNHLDLHAVEWLEAWIDEWDGAALIVSHDRYFLDQIVSAVWEMHSGAVTEFRGNYSAYLVQRAERHARRLAEFEARQEHVAKEQAYIRRNLAGQNTKQAKGRLRRLERMLREPTAQHPQDNRVFKPPEAQTIKLRMSTDLRSGDRVIETHDLAVGYQDDGKVLFRAPDVLLWREECAALIGPNGAGKTTFLRTLLGDLPPLSGSVKLGSRLKVGYFAQAHEDLRPERTVLEEILSVQEMPPGKARDYAARFLFMGDDVFKPVAVLSGGERGRVALAKLALAGANLLLLDEPTNHLDIPSQEILEAVLADFPGTILLVSHDRYLIDALATQIWSLEEGRLEVFKGSWSEYVAWKEEASRFKVQDSKPGAQASNPNLKSALKNLKSEERQRAAWLAEVERTIAALEARLVELTRDLEQAGSGGEVARVRALGEEYAQVEAELAAHLSEWESLAA
jgi:ATP-binding cassette subfamily F protein 3